MERFLKKHGIILFFLFMTIFLLFIRIPSCFVHKTLSIEDGPVFFTEAAKYGFGSFFVSYAGYYHTLLRLLAYIASFFPLTYIPVIYMIFAVFFRFLAVCACYYMLDLKKYKYGQFVALLPLLLPFESDIYENITNLQWFFALFFALFLSKNWEKINNYLLGLINFLFATTGPYSVLFFPILVIRALIYKDLKTKFIGYATYLLGMFCQFFSVMNSTRTNVSDEVWGKIPFYFQKSIFYLTKLELFSVVVFVLLLIALFKIIKTKSYKENFTLLSLFYAGIIIFLSATVIILANYGVHVIFGRYFLVYFVSTFLLIICTFKNKYITLFLLMITLFSFTPVERKNIYWDQYVKLSKFVDEIFIDIYPARSHAKIENKNVVSKSPDYVLKGNEYVNPQKVCSTKYVGFDLVTDKYLETIITKKDDDIYDNLYPGTMNNGMYKINYMMPVENGEYKIVISPKYKINMYCID